MAELTAVVTIYKIDEYLEKCLNSIKNQSYEDFKVLMVVGNNDTKCISICEQFQKTDKRFVVVLAEPRGLSDARNVGIAKTDTEFITFIDGDDYISRDMFEILMKGIHRYSSDISVGNYALDKACIVKKHQSIIADGVYSSNDMLIKFLCGHDIQPVVAWGKVYKTKLFVNNMISYPLGKLHEDNLTTYKLLYNAARISCCNEAVYVYVEREASLSHNNILSREQVIIDDFSELQNYLSKRISLRDYVKSYETSICVSYLIKLSKFYDEKSNEKYAETVQRIKETGFWNNTKVRFRMRILCLAVTKAPRLLKNILKTGLI